MEPPVRVLMLEDNPYDQELSCRELAKAGLAIDVRRVDSRDGFVRAISEHHPDVALLDYEVPGFGGLAAMKAARELVPDLPCIVVTGSLDEETAAGCIKAGAADYVLKSNLARLPSAVLAALESRRITLENRLAQERLFKINACFLSFGSDSVENIARLTALCGELMTADCAFYNRVDARAITVVGQWRPPADYNPAEALESRVCRDAAHASDGLFVARQLSQGPYARGPEARHGFESYVGRAVGRGPAALGSLCALYRRGFVPQQAHERVMGIIAGAIGVEEARLGAEQTRARLAEELRQSQKMEAIGRLAGGVAHDFNNALTAIKGHCELLMTSRPEDSQERQDLSEINQAADYATALTRQLLAFSRKQILSPRVFSLDPAIKNVSTLLRRSLGETIEFIIVAGAPNGLVKADPGQIEQILMNLVINARDAMPEGGRLTIETSESVDSVTLLVRDTGMGMDAATVERIFEPFFTTKDKGKGTGLGLSTVYGIVKQSGGEISVKSAPGAGTTFAITLPSSRDWKEEPAAAAGAAAVARGRETVLLVEDDATVRALCGRVLRRDGYTVIEAADAAGALEELSRQQHISLMVTDLVMPGMNGRQLAARAADRRAEMKVLYISGYADETIMRQGLLEAGMELLQKPFSPSDFVWKVRRLLDSRG